MLNRNAIGVAIALGVGATWSGAALAAEGPMPAGTLAISGEHLSGFFHTSINASAGGVDSDGTVDHFALLGMGAGVPAELPRIGIDGFVVDGLSLGGTLGIDYAAQDQSVSLGAGAFTAGANGSSKTTTITFAPRIGFAMMFTNSVGIWPRAGVAYYHASITNEPIPTPGTPAQTQERSLHFISLSLDVPFIFAVSNGFAFTAGPMLETSLDGSFDVDNPPPGATVTSVDMSYLTFGASIGLMGWI